MLCETVDAWITIGFQVSSGEVCGARTLGNFIFLKGMFEDVLV